MPRDFRLWATQDFYEVANANLLISHEVEEPEAGIVSQGLKELLHVEWLRSPCHRECIRLDEYEIKRYIHIGEYVSEVIAWQNKFLIPFDRSMVQSQRAPYRATTTV
jgi:hypothetical protein